MPAHGGDFEDVFIRKSLRVSMNTQGILYRVSDTGREGEASLSFDCRLEAQLKGPFVNLKPGS